MACMLCNLAWAAESSPLAYQLRFSHLDTSAGPADARIWRIVQGRQGFVWVGTEDMGIWRFDGLRWRRYPVSQPDAVKGWVRALLVARDGRVWAGDGDGGLFRYDEAADDFLAVRVGDFGTVPVRSLFQSRDGQIWVGTLSRGLARFTPGSPGVTWMRNVPGNAGSLSNNKINQIRQAADGSLWIATNHGLNRLPEGSEKVEHIFLDYSAPVINCVLPEPDGELYVGTDEGLYVLDTNSGKTRSVEIPGGKRPTVLGLVRDHAGWLWVLSSQNGVVVQRGPAAEYRLYSHTAWDTTSPHHNALFDVMEDRTGLLWFAGERGISTLNKSGNAFHVIRHRPNGGVGLLTGAPAFSWFDHDSTLWISDQKQLLHLDEKLAPLGSYPTHGPPFSMGDVPRTYSIRRDASMSLWAGFDSGIGILDPSSGRITGFKARRPGFQPVGLVGPDRWGNVWSGSWNDGLIRIHGDRFIHYPQSRFSVSGDFRSGQTLGVFVDDDVAPWIPTANGVAAYDGEADRFDRVIEQSGLKGGVFVNKIAQDGSGHLWLAANEGLGMIERLPDQPPRIRLLDPQPQGLAPPAVAMSIDHENRLWLWDSRGLLGYDPVTAGSVRYDQKRGLPAFRAFYMSGDTAPDGRISFFDSGKVLVFDPAQLQPNRFAPDTALTKIAITGDATRELAGMPGNRLVRLTHTDRAIRFEFAALDFNAPALNRYRYRLGGFNPDWVNLGHNAEVTFTSLNPGNYQFSVQGANADGVWGAPTSPLVLHITPAWWASTWAYAGYVALMLFSIAWYRRLLTARWQRQRGIAAQLREANQLKQTFVNSLERRVRQATAELEKTVSVLEIKNLEVVASEKKAQKASEFKSRFVANISHDLRTPLTGLLGHLELLSATHVNSEQQRYISTVRDSANDLLDIISELLDFSKIEAGKLDLVPVGFRVRKTINHVLQLLGPIADEKGLTLTVVVSPQVPEHLVGDVLRIKQIITNLVGNALKFTTQGHVHVQVDSEIQSVGDLRLVCAVTDTGIGISEAGKEKLFRAFSQADGSISSRFGGTGLGLSICKQLSTLMGGSLEIESREGHGSIFRVAIKLQRDDDAAADMLPLRGYTVTLCGAAGHVFDEVSATLEFLGAKRRVCEPMEDLAGVINEAEPARPIMLVLDPALDANTGKLTQLLQSPHAGNVWITVPRMDRKLPGNLEKTAGVCIFPVRTLLHDLEDQFRSALPPAPVTAKAGVAGRRILVCEDDALSRALLEALLLKYGATVDMLQDAEEAVRRLRRGDYDLAILNADLPAFARSEIFVEIRGERPKGAPLRILGLTGAVDQVDAAADCAQGLDCVLQKPFSAAQLAAALKPLEIGVEQSAIATPETDAG